MFGHSSHEDDPDYVEAADLASAIEESIRECYSHLGYIESALHQAERYAHGLRHKHVPKSLHAEGWDFVSMARQYVDSFATANEVALNLRRAGDVPLNNSYG